MVERMLVGSYNVSSRFAWNSLSEQGRCCETGSGLRTFDTVERVFSFAHDDVDYGGQPRTFGGGTFFVLVRDRSETRIEPTKRSKRRFLHALP